jgi:hypothetical protein
MTVAAPLVSIIVRSMDRRTLPETLDSIAAQTYANLEVVVVLALGSRHHPLPPLQTIIPPSNPSQTLLNHTLTRGTSAAKAVWTRLTRSTPYSRETVITLRLLEENDDPVHV